MANVCPFCGALPKTSFFYVKFGCGTYCAFGVWKRTEVCRTTQMKQLQKEHEEQIKKIIESWPKWRQDMLRAEM